MDLQKLKQNFSGEILTDDQTLAAYSRDASIFEIRPEVVVCPNNVEDVKNLVKMVSAEKAANPNLSITARSGGTDMGGGSINDSILVDFTKHFNKIIGVETVRPLGGKTVGFARTQPGVFYRDFEPKTLEKGLIMPTFPASRNLCTVGGMSANNSGGEKSLSYGQTKDYIEELKVVLSDGNEYVFSEIDELTLEAKRKLSTFEGHVYRHMYQLIKDNYELIKKSKPSTSKNSSGYFLWEVWNSEKKTFNLAKLLVGSQGTLGLITEIKYRLVPVQAKSELLVIFMKDLGILGDVVKTVLQHKPETFESYDNHTFKLAMKFLPAMMKQMKGNIIKLGFQFLPEVWLTITGGVPKLVLIAEFAGDTEAEIFAKMQAAEKDLHEKFELKTHMTKSAAEAEKYWTMRRESFNLLRQHTKGLSTAPFIDDIIVHPKDLPEFLPRLNAILDKYPRLIYTIAGHAGDANFHIIPLMDLTDPENHRIIPLLSEEVYKLVLDFKGSITAEHNDGLIRTPYLEKMYGRPMCALFEQTKQIFDPQNIFNPRKKVFGSLEYAMEHIKKK